MIHYTLLPETEIRLLRKEYRTRLFVVFVFFISIAVFVGLISLLPSYILSRTEEGRVMDEVDRIKRERESKGISQIGMDFAKTQGHISRILSRETSVPFSNSIERIISHRINGIFIHSFDLSYVESSATNTQVAISGRATTRDSLIAFKKKLLTDSNIKNVDLPVSDLAKNKNISFNIKMDIIK